jgi:hypothetical protein
MSGAVLKSSTVGGGNWGENGFWYFDYDDLQNFVAESFIIIPKLKVSPPAYVEASRGVYEGKILISWEQNGASRYAVYRLEEDGSYRLLGETMGNAFEDTGVQPGEHCFYSIAAIVDGVQSEYSSPAEGWAVKPQDMVPGIPQQVALAQNQDGILVTWNRVPSASTYEIYWWDAGEAAFILAGRTEDNFFQGISVPRGRLLACFVLSVNKFGKSMPSSLAVLVLDRNTREDADFVTPDYEKYQGRFYQFPAERFYRLERRLAEGFSRIERRLDTYFTGVNQRLEKFFNKKEEK